MKHHPNCFQPEGTEHGHSCFDKAGNELRPEPVSPALASTDGIKLARSVLADQAKSVPFGYSATGIPVHAIASIPRPLNFGLDPDGHPANFQTEQYFRHIGSLKPLVTNEVLSTVELKGDKDDWRPEGPRIEVAYSDETGVKIEMEMTITEEMKPYYDADMVLASLTNKLRGLAGDVNRARRLHGSIEGNR